jgi:hypothetical protein
MARLAGDERTYRVALGRRMRLHDGDPCPTCDKPLGKYQLEKDAISKLPVLLMGAPRKTVEHKILVATEHGEDWVSISTVAGIIDKGGALSGWAYNAALEGILKLIDDGVDLVELDFEQLKARMKQAGYTPWVKRDRAAERGTQVHEEVLEALGLGTPPEEVKATILALDDDIRGYGVGAFRWYEDEAPEPLLVEAPVWSSTHRTVGTLDLYATRKDGRNVLSDLKTSKDVYESHPVQLDGYALCVNELISEGVLDTPRPDAHSIVLSRPDGTYEERFLPSDPAAFIAALELTKAVMKTKAFLKGEAA